MRTTQSTHFINVCLTQQGKKLDQQDMGTTAAVISQCTARELRRHLFPRNSKIQPGKGVHF